MHANKTEETVRTKFYDRLCRRGILAYFRCSYRFLHFLRCTFWNPGDNFSVKQKNTVISSQVNKVCNVPSLVAGFLKSIHSLVFESTIWPFMKFFTVGIEDAYRRAAKLHCVRLDSNKAVDDIENAIFYATKDYKNAAHVAADSHQLLGTMTYQPISVIDQ